MRKVPKYLTNKNLFLFNCRERFLVLDFPDKFEAALQVLAQWYGEGKIKVSEILSLAYGLLEFLDNFTFRRMFYAK